MRSCFSTGSRNRDIGEHGQPLELDDIAGAHVEGVVWQHDSYNKVPVADNGVVGLVQLLEREPSLKS
jgi:hypothetical protein